MHHDHQQKLLIYTIFTISTMIEGVIERGIASRNFLYLFSQCLFNVLSGVLFPTAAINLQILHLIEPYFG